MYIPMLKKHLFTVLILSALIPLLASCGATNKEVGVKAEEHTGTMVVDHANREVRFTEPPQRIVSLVSGDMEIVHALGGDVVARPNVDEKTISEELGKLPEIGNTHDVNFEKMLSLKPDLVIGHSGLNAKDVSTIESFGIETILTNSKSYDVILETINMYGVILNKEREAEALIQSLEQKKTQILANPLPNEVNALIIYGTTDTFMVALPSSLTGSLLEMAGGTNIAQQFPSIDGYPDYAQMPLERIIKANPDVIYFITHGEIDAVKERFAAELKANAAWENVNAIKDDQLVFLPPALFSSNPGPRIGEALEFIKNSLVEVSS
ncbi:ABC transporter substrate-binding protein [Robertmurraya massiliosenegalensis]|uniref:ABC transporter substrate-binding protein n=1 Tax=Robertmurraya TaxID=2837507 RepID=UPI0039A5380B